MDNNVKTHSKKSIRKKTIISAAITLVIAIAIGLVAYFVYIPLIARSTGDYQTYINKFNIENFTIPDGTKEIKNGAFAYCKNLKSITIPDSVTTIGEFAFDHCTSLESITFGSGVTSIGTAAFQSCTSLKSITVPDTVTAIGTSVFSDCSNLESAVIGSALSEVSDYTFSHCVRLREVIIGNNVAKIGLAFANCTSLTSITIGKNVSHINSDTFENSHKLVEVINHSNLNVQDYIASVKEIHTGESKIVNYKDFLFFTHDGINYLLGYTGNCTDLILPESYNGNDYEIYSYAFYSYDNAISITSVTIGNGVKAIGEYAFYCCKDLKSVTISENVTSIGYEAFFGCIELKDVYYTAAQEAWSQIQIRKNNESLTEAQIHYNHKSN